MSARDISLPAHAASVPLARRFVRGALRDLNAADASDVAESLVSELATNAVLHARTPFTIEASRDGDLIRICVQDGSLAPARPRRYGTGSTTGRGLRLVATQATAWGVQQTGQGKIVWFEIPADGPTDAPGWDDEVDLDVLLASFEETVADAADGASPGTSTDAIGLGWAA